MTEHLPSGIAARLELAPQAYADTTAVAAALASLFGEEATGIAPLGGGSTSETFGFAVGNRDLVVKTNTDVSVLAHAERNLRLLAELGVPVPTVVSYDGSLRHAPFAMLVMERLRGRELGLALPSMSRAEMSDVAARVIDMQKAVSTLPANSGCGFVGIGEVATRTWADVVHHPSARPLADPWPSDCGELVPRLHAVIELASPLLDLVEPICFLDDLTTKNVLVEGRRLVGVVDFDVVCYGDPLFQIGLTAASISAGFPSRCAFYVEELVRHVSPPEVGRILLSLYEAVFLTHFVAAESPHSSAAWRDVVILAAGRRLDDVERALA